MPALIILVIAIICWILDSIKAYRVGEEWKREHPEEWKYSERMRIEGERIKAEKAAQMKIEMEEYYRQKNKKFEENH